jgi:aryl-alcohol dehydrogenase-like predicted oxidoreductase
MNKRKLGRSGLEVAPWAFGGNVLGWTVDEPTAFTLLDGFVEAGFNLIDTADVYSTWVPGNKGGESETAIGRWLKQSGNRSKVLIATKVGSPMAPGKKGLSRPYILQAIEDSLQRLQTDYIDLYQSHIDDRETPLEETLGAYAELIEQRKVRAIGASNYTAERLAEALQVAQRHGYPRYESLQTFYNLYDREEYESALEPLCLNEQVGVLSYFSLASGFLTGKYRSEADLSKSARGSRVKQYLNERGFRILRTLDEVAKKYDSTPVRIALAWVMARPSITTAIASATNLDQMKDLMAATKLHLDVDAIRVLDEASAPGQGAGAAR